MVVKENPLPTEPSLQLLSLKLSRGHLMKSSRTKRELGLQSAQIGTLAQ